MSKKRSPNEIQDDSRAFLKAPKDDAQPAEVDDDANRYEDPWEDEFDSEEEHENEEEQEDNDDNDSSHFFRTVIIDN